MIEKENRNWNEMFGAIPAMGNLQQQNSKLFHQRDYHKMQN